MPSRWSDRDTQTLSAVAMSALLLAGATKPVLRKPARR